METKSTPASVIKKPENYNLWLFGVLITYLILFVREDLQFFFWHTITFIIAEILIRIAQYAEYSYVFRKYKNVPSAMVYDIFSFESVSKTSGFIIAVICIFITKVQSFNCIALTSAYVFMRVCKFGNSRYMKKLWIENSEGLDYGSGMAYSFFYGYLNIILPNKGDQNKSIKELMQTYEGDEKIKFSEYKMFLLINKNLFITPDLSSMSNSGDVHMESCKTLLSIERNRAGVKNRSYKNTVYKIYRKDQPQKPYYVVSEGATPLLTLYEALKSSGDDNKNHEKHIDEIISQFYRTLKNLLESHFDCKDVCELIYFDSNVNKDIGELLLERIGK